MRNGQRPIFPTAMQKVGENEYRAHRPNDAKEFTIQCEGLTKREYFAAMAMQGMLASQYDDLVEGYFPGFDITANRAIAYADALLKQLES